ncbi:MAG: hypothetical protein F4X40_05195 [Chloroflexi bacterium]|nr:hypothetical protein [Chloroflexota bacterium]
MPWSNPVAEETVATIVFLVKFYENRVHADEFVGGRVFANRLSRYKKGPRGDFSGRTDPDEGTFLWAQPGRGQLIVNGMDISGDLVAPIQMQKDWVNNLHVFCVHAANSGDVNLGSLSKANVAALRGQLVIPDRCLTLGKHAVVIRDVPEFIRQMRAAAREKNYGIGWGRVKYYDPATFHGKFEDIESVFRKQSRFKFQREFRFVINSNSTGDCPLTMNIGNLSDITMRFRASELRGDGWLQQLEIRETP